MTEQQWTVWNYLMGKRQEVIDGMCHDWRRDNGLQDYWPIPNEVLESIWASVPRPEVVAVPSGIAA